MNKKLTRRPGSETHRTYWLVAAGVGFLKVHTADPDNARQVRPELEALAEAVAVAPGMAALLRRAADFRQGFEDAESRPEAAALLSDIRATVPGGGGRE